MAIEQKPFSGLAMTNSYNIKNTIDDFLKSEYQEGLRNEFNTMEALINKLSQDTISGKKKYKTFALGITDNVRAVGEGLDRYTLGLGDFMPGHGVDTVEAEFDTTKIMATFAITDEAILKGTGDGTFLDVFKDQLDRMEVGQKHTMQRYTYGAPDGKIGKINKATTASGTAEAIDVSSKYADDAAYGNDASVKVSSEKPNSETEFYKGSWNRYFPAGTKVFKFTLENSYSMLPGMGLLLRTGTGDTKKTWAGYIWQKDNSIIGKEKVLFVCQKYYEGTTSKTVVAPSDTEITAGVIAYSRQLDDSGEIAKEYTGLGAILEDMDTYKTVFNVNRELYPQLKSPSYDLDNKYYLSEELMRDMADHLNLSTPEGTAINLVVSNYRIISQVEKNLYQLKEYNNYVSGSNMQFGGEKGIKFDNYTLMKDKFSRGNHVYFLDTGKIGELVRRDWTWITSGEVNGVLQRRDGTEMYEGIMNKYADMYVDTLKAHAIIKNCKVVEGYDNTFGQSFAKPVNVVGTVSTKEQA